MRVRTSGGGGREELQQERGWYGSKDEVMKENTELKEREMGRSHNLWMEWLDRWMSLTGDGFEVMILARTSCACFLRPFLHCLTALRASSNGSSFLMALIILPVAGEAPIVPPCFEPGLAPLPARSCLMAIYGREHDKSV